MRVLPDPAAVARDAATEVVEAAQEAVAARGVFHLALSGGSTPRAAYARLAARGVDASRWELWFGDERFVPHDHPDSNARMVEEAWLRRADDPPRRVHRVPVDERTPEAAARAYAEELAREVPGDAAGTPVLDLALLGVGVDGHTASLFPGGVLREEERGLVAWARAPGIEHDRVTLTLRVLVAARAVRFLAVGAEKARIVRDVLLGHDGPAFPAERVAPTSSDVAWLVDAAAGADLIGRGEDVP